MNKIAGPVKFTFLKNTKISIEDVRKKYSIKIPETLVSEIEVNIEFVSNHNSIPINIIAEKEIIIPEKNDKQYTQINSFLSHFIKPNEKSIEKTKDIDFKPINRDFKADAILIDCNPTDNDATILILINKK